MDGLSGQGGPHQKGQPKNLLGNALVLVGPKDAARTYESPRALTSQARCPADVSPSARSKACPPGIYAKQSLISLGAWDAVKDKLAEAENVRAALLLVSRGEAPLGIVYMTDSKADAGVKVVGTFPENAHDPIIYPVAELKNAPALAAEFPEISSVQEGGSELHRQGFTVLSAK